MRILFVWPNREDFTCKPIGISLLSAILKREGHEVRLFDTSFMDLGGKDFNEDLTKHGYFKPVDWGVDVSKKKVNIGKKLYRKTKRFNPDAILISALSDEKQIVIDMIRMFQDITRAHIFVGNKGAESLHKEMPVPGVTYCIGEFASVIVDAVTEKAYIREPVIVSPGYVTDLDSLPPLDWSIFDDRHFLKAFDGKVYRGGDHMIGWGCVGSCAYCINEHWRELHGGMKGSMRHYGAERITDELQALSYMYHLEFWKFHDEDFLLKPTPYFHDLVEQYLLKVDLPFTCMANAKSVTPERVKLLKKMGCVSVSMGVETGDPVMRQVLRRRETPEEIIDAVWTLQDAGIRVSAFNMIGLPFESIETIEATISLNRAAGIKHPNVSLFMPLEGTKLYDLSVAYGFYEPGQSIQTDRPSLKLPGITEEKLMWYYHNFHDLVTKGNV